MATPLLSQLNTLAESAPLRLHMPGHKGQTLPGLENWAAIDFTELPPTGNLFEEGGTIQAAEALWADKFGAEGCLFLTGGSTLGLHTAIHLCCRPGDKVLTDRASHRALWNALALVDVEPVFLSRLWLEEEFPGPISPGDVEEMLTAHPEITAVVITSPTYYGVDCDCQAIGEICHRHGARLIVDSAHGAHYPWIGKTSPARWADVTCVSAHKTLPAPGQTALLFCNGFTPAQVRRAAMVYSTSSPSYFFMGALDAVRDHLDRAEGYTTLTGTLLPAFSARLNQETRFRRILTDDPARLVISTAQTGYTGFEIGTMLEKQGIYMEMCDRSHLVGILTGEHTEADLTRLFAALKELSDALPARAPLPPLPPPPELPPRVCSMRQAIFGDTETRPLKDCEGKTAAQQIAPYPPGIPVISPGEKIIKKHLAYLKEIGYNTLNECEVLR